MSDKKNNFVTAKYDDPLFQLKKDLHCYIFLCAASITLGTAFASQDTVNLTQHYMRIGLMAFSAAGTAFCGIKALQKGWNVVRQGGFRELLKLPRARKLDARPFYKHEL